MATRIWTRALVTGASAGIGEHFARHLAGVGSHLTLVARRGEVLHALATRLGEQQGVDVEVIEADLTEPEQLRRVEDRLQQSDDPVDLLVNNAGMGGTGAFADQKLSREEKEIQLNVTAVMRLTHAAIPGMRERGHGGILNVTSFAGFQPLPYMATYSATKAFVTSFTEAVHEELRGSGVHVTAVAPGFVRAGMNVDDEGRTQLPDAVLTEPGPVVEAALDALADNRALVVPGLGYRVAATVTRAMPSMLIRRAAGLGLGRR